MTIKIHCKANELSSKIQALESASPELLAAAIDMVEWFGEVNRDAFDSGEIDLSTLDWVGLHKVLDRATAAIAKAKGGSK